MDWTNADQTARDLAYNNRAAVPACEPLLARWEAESAAFRAARPQHLDLAYGKLPRNKWDLYPAAEANAPCLVFIHGGYWQRNGRESFACCMEGAMARGWSTALPGYTLAPDASIAEIAAEMKSALDWLAANRAAHGMTGKVILSGWSAGGHLAAQLADHPVVHAALAISGLFDLTRIRDTYLNAALQLTDADIASCSPQFALPAKRICTAWGSVELPELVRQSQDFAAARATAGLPGGALAVAGANHFTIMESLRHPQGPLLSAAAALLT